MAQISSINMKTSSLWSVFYKFGYPFTIIIWLLNVCCCSVAQLYATLCNLMDCSTPGLSVPHQLPKFVQVHAHCIGDAISHLILWCPLLLLPSTFPRIRDFTNESAVCIRWPKYWSFSISPSIDYSGWISLKIDWLVLLAVQGTHRSLLQHHISKASVLQHSSFFLVRLSLSLPCVTTGKTTALTIWGTRVFHPVALLKLMFL